MSNETSITIITPKNLPEAKELANTLSAARTIPEALQKSPADVLAIVMAGAELGLAPMQAVRALVLIKGKPTLSADAMGALVKSRRDVCEFLLLKHSDATRATYATKRAGDPEPTVMSFTIEEAKQAGLNGDNWRKFPAAMLRARALSAICRAVYPDLLLGVYDPDELAPEPPRVAQVIDSTPSPKAWEQAMADAKAKGDEVGEVLGLVRIAQTIEALNALVPRIQKLPDFDKGRVRTAWGERRDALQVKPSPTPPPPQPPSAPQHFETEEVPS